MSYRASMFSFMTLVLNVDDGTVSCKKKHVQTRKDKKWNHYKCAKSIKRTRNPHRANRHLYTNKDM